MHAMASVAVANAQAAGASTATPADAAAVSAAGNAAATSVVDATTVTADGAPAASLDASSVNAASANAASTSATATNAPHVGKTATTGVTFPVRPTTTTATQAPAVGHASAADAGSIGGALFSLVLVVGLILALGWLAKRMPGMQRGAGTAGLKVVASVALGPRDRAVVVDVGGTQLLLGVGQGGVRALHTLDAPLPVVESGAPSPFAQVLAQHFGRKP